MNSRWAKIGGVVTLAVGLTGLMALPASAAPEPKATVCHFQAEDEFDAGADGILGTEDDVLVEPLGWRIINISGNALSAHVGIHGDGTTSDFAIVTEEDLAACQSLVPFVQ